MKIVTPSFEILHPALDLTHRGIISQIEQAARTCYKSEGLGAAVDPSEFVRRIVQVQHHESVIEHASVTVRFVCDRGVTHELVRHRLAAYSQESTRYCNYGKERFGQEIAVIEPPGLNEDSRSCWFRACRGSEAEYLDMLTHGASPQIARSVLPTCLATTIVMTANLREWKHVFKLRTPKAAHPQIRALMLPLFRAFCEYLPEIYDDMQVEQ